MCATLPAHIQLAFYMSKVLYCNSLPELATDNTFIQAVERLIKIHKSVFPPTPKNLFYQGLLMVDCTIVSVLFCNIKYIEPIKNEKKIISGCDGNFKTVSKTIDWDCYQLFMFHVIYYNVSFPMVYTLLTSKTEIIYKELFLYDCNVLTLQYDKLTIITVYEISQIKSIALIFPEINHQSCYFHYSHVHYVRSTLNLNTKLPCISVFYVVKHQVSPHLNFHLFHKNKNKKMEWLKSIKLDDYSITNWRRICSNHFIISGYRQKLSKLANIMARSCPKIDTDNLI